MGGYIRLLSWNEFNAIPLKRQRDYVRTLRRAKMNEREIAASMGISSSCFDRWKAAARLPAGTAKTETLCWSCSKAVKGCSWSSSFTPVEGWEAEPAVIKNVNGGKPIDSYNVIRCPEYEADKAYEKKAALAADILRRKILLGMRFLIIL